MCFIFVSRGCANTLSALSARRNVPPPLVAHRALGGGTTLSVAQKLFRLHAACLRPWSRITLRAGAQLCSGASTDCMDDAEKDPHFDKLEVIANDALKQVLGCKEHRRIWSRVESTDESTDLEPWASITRFGSRVYGLATETSDADYWLPCLLATPHRRKSCGRTFTSS